MNELSIVKETNLIILESPKKYVKAFEEEATTKVDSNNMDLTKNQYKCFLNAVTSLTFLLGEALTQEQKDKIIKTRQGIINIAGELGYNRHEIVRSSLFYSENKALFKSVL
ncbi:hypothetical protein BC30090_p227 (plasmid) [Bacillus cereus]|jgi:hypothetical protein|uniref:hypothetical protein n=1 Tax=Bacillus cereus group TaxID=86661 RepID=UPI000A30356F|nr:hypothetical protein [Bacillus cereus]HDX9575712.1 hypothetical protein [Bacillus mobilis]MBL3742157.1 hypothetical protein [Bacillus cereus]MBL3864466.1 hypothetical protein [Bacillus cereus]MBL3881385.1 hypothetical protein [Bacillus cereus]SMD66402.1 hypothetical protein BACERE00184_00609 [Bacillus cereus]